MKQTNKPYRGNILEFVLIAHNQSLMYTHSIFNFDVLPNALLGQFKDFIGDETLRRVTDVHVVAVTAGVVARDGLQQACEDQVHCFVNKLTNRVAS